MQAALRSYFHGACKDLLREEPGLGAKERAEILESLERAPNGNWYLGKIPLQLSSQARLSAEIIKKPPYSNFSLEFQLSRVDEWEFSHTDRLESRRASGAGLSPQTTGMLTAFHDLVDWQTIRVRNIFYRHVTQRPMTPGLMWFIRFYGRISAARRPLNLSSQVASAAHIGGLGKGLQSLEVRTTPFQKG